MHFILRIWSNTFYLRAWVKRNRHALILQDDTTSRIYVRKRWKISETVIPKTSCERTSLTTSVIMANNINFMSIKVWCYSKLHFTLVEFIIWMRVGAHQVMLRGLFLVLYSGVSPNISLGVICSAGDLISLTTNKASDLDESSPILSLWLQSSAGIQEILIFVQELWSDGILLRFSE